jgi:hypothetical protein
MKLTIRSDTEGTLSVPAMVSETKMEARLNSQLLRPHRHMCVYFRSSCELGVSLDVKIAILEILDKLATAVH